MTSKTPNHTQEPNKMINTAVKDVGRSADLRTKVVEILSSTTNESLLELGYFPELKAKMLTMNGRIHKLQTDNDKLYEDNTKMARLAAMQRDRLSFIEAPQAEQLQKVLELKDTINVLQGKLHLKERENGVLFERFQRVEQSYVEAVKDKGDLCKRLGMQLSNNQVPSTHWPGATSNQYAQVYRVSPGAPVERHLESAPCHVAAGPAQNSHSQNPSRSSTPTYPVILPQHAGKRRTSDGVLITHPPQHQAQHMHNEHQMIRWPMPGDGTGQQHSRMAHVPTMNQYFAVPAHAHAHLQRHGARPPGPISTMAASPLSHLPSPVQDNFPVGHDRSHATSPTSAQSVHFPIGPRVTIPANQGHIINPLGAGPASAPIIMPSYNYPAQNTNQQTQRTSRSVPGHQTGPDVVDLTADEGNHTTARPPPPMASPSAQHSSPNLKRPSSAATVDAEQHARNEANKKPRISDSTELRSPRTGYHTPVSQASSPSISTSKPPVRTPSDEHDAPTPHDNICQDPVHSPPDIQQDSHRLPTPATGHTPAAALTNIQHTFNQVPAPAADHPTAVASVANIQQPFDPMPLPASDHAPSAITQQPQGLDQEPTPAPDHAPATNIQQPQALDQQPTSASEPQSPSPVAGSTNTGEGPNLTGLSPEEKCVMLTFEHASNQPEGRQCKLCSARFEKGFTFDRPHVWIDANTDELAQHCKTDHPAAWDHLQILD